MISRVWLEEWCTKHNATLIDMQDTGFAYMTNNGITWFITYEEYLANL